MSSTNVGNAGLTAIPNTKTQQAADLSKADAPKSFIELSTGLHLLGGLRDNLSMHSLLPAWHLGIHGVGIGANEAHSPDCAPSAYSERTPGSYKQYSAGQLAVRALKDALAAAPEGAPLEEALISGNRSVAAVFERFGVEASRAELLPGASTAFVRIPRQAATSGIAEGELQVVACGAAAVLIEFKDAPPCIIVDGFDRFRADQEKASAVARQALENAKGSISPAIANKLTGNALERFRLWEEDARTALVNQPHGFLLMNGSESFEREATARIARFPLSEIKAAFAFSQNLMLPEEKVDRNKFAERLIGFKDGSLKGDPRDSWIGALYADSRQKGYKDSAYEASIYGWQFR